MGDVNKTTHTGTADSKPSFTYLSNKTPISIFTLKVRENWTNRAGVKQSRDNFLKFEALSKNAHWVKENVKVGRRYYIDGYARTDLINGIEDQKFRILHITEEDDEEYQEGKKVGYKLGVNQTLSIFKHIDNIKAAMDKMDIIISNI